jgi:hypothetical protein
MRPQPGLQRHTVGTLRIFCGLGILKWLLETTGRLLRVLAPDPEARAELLDAMVNFREPIARLTAKEMVQTGEGA